MKTLIARFLLPFLALLLLLKVQGQDRKIEIQLYTAPLTAFEVLYDSEGPLEYGGLSFEYYIKENMSIGLSASKNSDANSDLSQVVRHPVSGNTVAHDYSIKEKNGILNFYFRKYTERNAKVDIFYGGYLRYWSYSYERLNTDQYSQEYREYFTLDEHPISYVDHKISLGFLTGVKRELSERVTISLTAGVGGSLPFMFFTSEKHFDEENNQVVKYAESLTDLHISLLGHLLLGFKF